MLRRPIETTRVIGKVEASTFARPIPARMLESAVLPRIHPMRLRIAKPFNDPDYIFELKHDGFRALAYVEEGKCKLVSRNSNLFKSFASLKASLGKLRVQDAIRQQICTQPRKERKSCR